MDEKDPIPDVFALLKEAFSPLMLACALIVLSGKHIRAARGLLGWTQRELATRARVGLGTVRRMEDADGPIAARTESLISVATALERAGVEFLDDGSPGVRLKKVRPTKS